MDKILKEKIQKQHAARRQRYGLSKAQFSRMVSLREGTCDICGKVPTGKRKTLCIDHDHSTGKIRGLLCNNCNMALGLMGDDSMAVSENVFRYKLHLMKKKNVLEKNCING